MKIKIEKVAIIIFSLLIIFLFIRGYILMRHNYKSIYSGLVIDKHKGSKGSRIISIQNIFDAKIVGLDILGNDEIYQIINKGDSILKNNNSYFINVYSKRKDKFKYLDSVELWHY